MDNVAYSIDDLIAKLIEFRKGYPAEVDYPIYTVDGGGLYWHGLRFEFRLHPMDRESLVLFK